jgi:hypothetical protein
VRDYLFILGMKGKIKKLKKMGIKEKINFKNFKGARILSPM